MLTDVPNTTTGPLADYTTLRLGGPADRLIEAHDADAIVAAVREADADSADVLLVAGGSNLVIGDAGFRGTAIVLRSTGITSREDNGRVLVTAQAGHTWDDVVATAVAQGWSGIECLSGIPGAAGATPIQNVGAYGQEIVETFDSATVYDRDRDRVVTFGTDDCRFGYRTSVFKRNPRYVVLDVTYRLHRSTRSQPIRYAETARSLGVDTGQTVDLAQARETVLKLRRGKGMVLDPSDPDTNSVGSFFMNPVMTTSDFDRLRDRVGDDTVPHWPTGDDIKVSAAWLIGRAGFTKGHGHDGVAISGKHTLALTNRGTGSTTALLGLATEIRDTVADRLGVTLHPEPVLVGTKW